MSTHAQFYYLVAHVQQPLRERYLPDNPAFTRAIDMLFVQLLPSAFMPLMALLPLLLLTAAVPVLQGAVRLPCSWIILCC